MNIKRIFATTTIFFLLITTTFFWEGKLGIAAFLVFTILFVWYVALLIILLWQIVLILKERFKNKQRIFITIFLLQVLCLVLLKPFGIIDFDQLYGKDVLVADREGGGNCHTILKLKNTGIFIETIVCFGVEKTIGKYEIKSDTIFFNMADKRNDYYTYALLKPADTNNKDILGAIVLYDDSVTSNELMLFIHKNNLAFK